MAYATTLVTDQRKHGKRLPRRTAAMAVLLTSVALFATSCSSSDSPKNEVANVGPSSSSPAAGASQGSGGGNNADPVKFAQCMRDNGMPDFKDPAPGVPLNANVDTNSEAYKKAAEACKTYSPQGAPQAPAGQVWSDADKLSYAKCMRANGVPSFPDPSKNGGFVVEEGSGGAVSPDSPQFKKAEEACKKFQPAGIQNGGGAQGPGPGSGS